MYFSFVLFFFFLFMTITSSTPKHFLYSSYQANPSQNCICIFFTIQHCGCFQLALEWFAVDLYVSVLRYAFIEDGSLSTLRFLNVSLKSLDENSYIYKVNPIYYSFELFCIQISLYIFMNFILQNHVIVVTRIILVYLLQIILHLAY